jgi:hypothetical protein
MEMIGCTRPSRYAVALVLGARSWRAPDGYGFVSVNEPVQPVHVHVPLIVLPVTFAVNGKASVPFAPWTSKVHVPVNVLAATVTADVGAEPVVVPTSEQPWRLRSWRPVTLADWEGVVAEVAPVTFSVPALLNVQPFTVRVFVYEPDHAPSSDSRSAAAVPSASSLIAQAALPVHPPLQPPNTEPAAGVGVSDTIVPRAKVPLHVVPVHVTPAGIDTTVPVPEPLNVTVSVTSVVFVVPLSVVFVVPPSGAGVFTRSGSVTPSSDSRGPSIGASPHANNITTLLLAARMCATRAKRAMIDDGNATGRMGLRVASSSASASVPKGSPRKRVRRCEPDSSMIQARKTSEQDASFGADHPWIVPGVIRKKAPECNERARAQRSFVGVTMSWNFL